MIETAEIVLAFIAIATAMCGLVAWVARLATRFATKADRRYVDETVSDIGRRIDAMSRRWVSRDELERRLTHIEDRIGRLENKIDDGVARLEGKMDKLTEHLIASEPSIRRSG